MLRRLDISLPVETVRLAIRRMVAGDAGARYAIQSDAEYVRFIGQPVDRATCDAQFDRELRGEADRFTAAITVRGHPNMIGECVLVPGHLGAHADEHEMTLAFMPGFRKRGYGFEAAEAIIEAALRIERVTRIYVRVSFDNPASRSLVAKLGLTREGLVPVHGDGEGEQFYRGRTVTGA